MKNLSSTQSMSEYLDRIEARLERTSTAERKIISILQVAKSAESHFQRCQLAKKRFERAGLLKDRKAVEFEKIIMQVLLYEAMDTVYMVTGLLDFDEFNLTSSVDGHGIAGDSAADLVMLLAEIEKISGRVLEIEKEIGLNLNFEEALDERKGITYTTVPHWQDFVEGSIANSFYGYFLSSKDKIKKQINKKPMFWKSQSVKQYLQRKNYPNLTEILRRLDEVSKK